MDENRISTGDAKTQRRNFLSLAVAATAGAIATVLSKSNEALAGHDGTNVFHLGVLNDGPAVASPTQLVANIDREALGPEGPFPPSAALMIFNGDGTTPNKGWALFAHGNPGAAGGVYGNSDSGDGVRGSSNTGAAVRAEGRSPSQPALVANWNGPSSSPHSGVAGFSSAGPGVHGQGVSGPGVIGTSSSGPGVEGRSGSGPGVMASANATGPGILGIASAGRPGVVGQGSPERSGVFGGTVDGLAMHGSASGTGVGVRGDSSGGAGVEGRSASGGGPGVRGSSSVLGVWGSGRDGNGVFGDSVRVAGVEGLSENGPGVLGSSHNPAGVGVSAINFRGGIALDVSGRARFTTAGNGTIPARADSQAVSNPAVQANSNVIATLTSDPGDVQIAWVERNPGSGFVLHLTKKVGAATSFAYLITESA